MVKKSSASTLKKLAYEFMLQNRAAALATADKKGQPHVATVYCLAQDDLSVYFVTRVEARKFANLDTRPTVALAFTDEEKMITLQLTGRAERVKYFEEEQQIFNDLLRLRYHEPNWPVPPVKMYAEGETKELAVIKVTPVEMTYASFGAAKNGRFKSFFQKVI